MSDFEILYIVLMILSIVVTLLLEIIKNTKKYPPLPQVAVTFCNCLLGLTVYR